MAGQIERWTFSEIQQFIAEYEKFPCLYNTKLTAYKDREQRRTALQELADLFQITADEVAKRFARLRSQYCRERAKLVAGAKSGSSTQEATLKTKVTWVHFESLHFIKEFCIPKTSRSNLPDASSLDQVMNDSFDEGSQTLDEEETQNDDETQEFDTGLPKKSTKRPTGNPKKLTKRQKIEQEEDSILQKAAAVLDKATTLSSETSSLDADDVFGQYVASELKSVKDEYTKKLIKHKINTVLFETQVPSVMSGGLFRYQATGPISLSANSYSQTTIPRNETNREPVTSGTYHTLSPVPFGSPANASGSDFSNMTNF